MSTAETTTSQQPRTQVGRGPILVGVDSSDGGQHALRWASALAGQSGKSIILAHAYSPWLGLSMSLPPIDYDAYKDISQKNVGKWAQSLNGTLQETRVIEDTPAEGLTLLAAETNPSLVVVGAHPRRHWVPHILGSTTSKVLHSAEYPTAVVPLTAETDMHGDGLVVGVDGSSSSLRALRWAADMGNLLDAPVYAVCTFPFEAYAEKPRLAELDTNNPVGVTLDALRSLASEVTAVTGREIASDVLIGHPADKLIDAASDANLLIVGKSGFASFGSDAVGSTARSCATHSRVPVIIVP